MYCSDTDHCKHYTTDSPLLTHSCSNCVEQGVRVDQACCRLPLSDVSMHRESPPHVSTTIRGQRCTVAAYSIVAYLLQEGEGFECQVHGATLTACQHSTLTTMGCGFCQVWNHGQEVKQGKHTGLVALRSCTTTTTRPLSALPISVTLHQAMLTHFLLMMAA